MLRAAFCLWLGCSLVGAEPPPSSPHPKPVTGEVVKVLPHLLDKQGRHTLSPSLFDRDAYQAELRRNPDRVSGIRYDVLWKARRVDHRPLTLRVELRGTYEGKHPRQVTLETPLAVDSSARRWTGLALTGEAYQAFGNIHAWRTTLWAGETLLGEQKSFLW